MLGDGLIAVLPSVAGQQDDGGEGAFACGQHERPAERHVGRGVQRDCLREVGERLGGRLRALERGGRAEHDGEFVAALRARPAQRIRRDGHGDAALDGRDVDQQAVGPERRRRGRDAERALVRAVEGRREAVVVGGDVDDDGELGLAEV